MLIVNKVLKYVNISLENSVEVPQSKKTPALFQIGEVGWV